MNILHLISSPRRDASFSIKLGNEIVERLQTKYPGSTVVTHNLTETHFPHLEEALLTSFMTPPEQRTAELAEAVKHSDEAIDELMRADLIVIGVPMYNFGIHSGLKSWLDHVMRSGKTFSYSAAGPEGLVKDKKVYLAVATGGVYTEGPMQSYDFTVPYLQKALGFIGLTDVTVYRVEGTAVPVVQDTAWDRAVAQLSI